MGRGRDLPLCLVAKERRMGTPSESLMGFRSGSGYGYADAARRRCVSCRAHPRGRTQARARHLRRSALLGMEEATVVGIMTFILCDVKIEDRGERG